MYFNFNPAKPVLAASCFSFTFIVTELKSNPEGINPDLIETCQLPIVIPTGNSMYNINYNPYIIKKTDSGSHTDCELACNL